MFLNKGNFKELSENLVRHVKCLLQNSPITKLGDRGSKPEVVEVMILTFLEDQMFLLYWPSQECMKRDRVAALASNEGIQSQSSLLAAVSANILLFDSYEDI